MEQARADDLSAAIAEVDIERVIDLSQPLTPEMAGWRGTEQAHVWMEEVAIDHCVPGGRVSATHLSMVAHAGTHVDAPRHFFPHGKSIDEYPTSRFVCRGVALDFRREEPDELDVEDLRAADVGIRPGDAVLLSFGWAERYHDDSYYDHPFLSAECAEYLADKDVSLVGADLITPDRPAHRRESPFSYPVHSALLGREIPIVENLGRGLTQVLGREFLFVMAPLVIPGADAAPVAPLAILCPEA